MTDKFETVRLRLLGEDYTIACEPEDRELLKGAGLLLDEQIETVQRQDPMLDTSNVLMLAALKLATNMLQSRRDGDSAATETIDSVRSVRRRVERRLKKVTAGGGGGAQAQAAS